MQRSGIESLESRKLFAGTAVVVNHVLVITGTDQADTLTLSTSPPVEVDSSVQSFFPGFYDVTLNGVTSHQPADEIWSIRVDLGSGNDAASITIANLPPGVGALAVFPPFPFVSIDGGAGDDSISVGGGVVVAVSGGDGNDRLSGQNQHSSNVNSDNIPYSRSGPQSAFLYLYGGQGDDVLVGGTGGNVVRGGKGNDICTGGISTDTIFGGQGDDTIRGNGDAPAGTYLTINGQTTATLSVYSDDDRDSIFGGDGNDSINGENGNDFIDGGAGNDTLVGNTTGRSLPSQRIYPLNLDPDAPPWAVTDEADTLVGGSGDDLLVGSDGQDELHGGEGNDVLFGGIGNDSLFGEDGRDVLRGGKGADTLVGGSQADELFGGADNDSLDARDGRWTDSLDGGAGDDTGLIDFVGKNRDSVRSLFVGPVFPRLTLVPAGPNSQVIRGRLVDLG